MTYVILLIGAVADDDEQAVWQRFEAWLKDALVPPLRTVLGPLDRWLDGLPPWAGSACAVGLFAAAAVWVLFLRREFVYRGAPDQSRWRDLRLWAILALVPYVVIYVTF